MKSLKKSSCVLLSILLSSCFIFSSCSDDSIALPPVSVGEVWASGFELDWDVADTEVTVQVSESDVFSALVADTTTSSISGIELRELKSNTSYFVRYQVLIGGEQSDFSPAISVQTAELSVPENAKVGRFTGDEIIMEWIKARGIKTEVQVSLSSTFESFVNGFSSVIVDADKIIIDPLEINTTYHIRSRSVNGDQASDWVTLSATTDDLIFFTFRSDDFESGDKMPFQFTCEGPSPELNWKNPPAGVESWAVTMIDLDFANGYAHWLLFNIPADVREVPSGTKPSGSLNGANGAGEKFYFGPCPPAGEVHRYVFTLYALDITLPLDNNIRINDFLEDVEGHILQQGILRVEYN